MLQIQYPRGIIENVLIKVDKFVLPTDFVILDMLEDSRVPIILGRPFFAIARAMIDVFNEKITLRVGEDEVIFNIDHSIKRPLTEDDECYGIDDLDNTINAEAQELLINDEPYLFLSRGMEKSIDQSDLEGCKPVECNTGNRILFEEDKIKESKLLIDELDPPRSSDFLPSPECDSVFYKDFSEVDTLTSTDNEDKVFNPGILIHENLFEVTIRVTNCAKNVKKTTNASLILEDFNPPLYELPFHKEVPGSETLSENEEKVFNPGILTSKGVHTSLLSELSHRDSKALKVIKVFEIPMENFPCSYEEDIRVLDVPCLHFYPS
ncbi:reverse transcriptase domain-containing protein [Tanacetum coccineum]